MNQFQMSNLWQTKLMVKDQDKISVSVEFYVRDAKELSGVCTIFWEVRKWSIQVMGIQCTCTKCDNPIIKKIVGSRTDFCEIARTWGTQKIHAVAKTKLSL